MNTVNLGDVIGYAGATATWAIANWGWLSGWVGMAALAVYYAKAGRYAELLKVVGALAYEAAKKEGLDTEAQKAWVAHQLYLKVSTPLVKGLITEAQCTTLVNLLWGQIDLHGAELEKEAKILATTVLK